MSIVACSINYNNYNFFFEFSICCAFLYLLRVSVMCCVVLWNWWRFFLTLLVFWPLACVFLSCCALSFQGHRSFPIREGHAGTNDERVLTYLRTSVYPTYYCLSDLIILLFFGPVMFTWLISLNSTIKYYCAFTSKCFVLFNLLLEVF